MTEDDPSAAPTDSRDGFLMEGLDEETAERAMAAVLEGDTTDVTTIPAEDVRTQVLDSVVDYFEHEYDADELGVESPDLDAVRSQWFGFEFLAEYEVVTWRWCRRPYAFTAIVLDTVENEFRYHVGVPSLTDFEAYVREDLTRTLRQELMHRTVEAADTRDEAFVNETDRVLNEHAASVPPSTLLRVVYYLRRDFVRFGKIDPLMTDSAIEDISCDGANVPLYVYHSTFGDLETNLTFDGDRLNGFVTRLAQRAGKSLTAADPLLDASLPDGSRAQFTFGNDVSLRGSTFTIRRFSENPLTPTNLLEYGTFGLDQMAYLWLLVENGKSVLFAGGTGSGKTTALNAISYFIPPGNKVVSIEDTPELRLPHENWVRNVTRSSAVLEGQGAITMFDLLESALRQRPEFLLVGEIRADPKVAFTFFQATATGHTAYSTFHADSAESTMRRLENEPLNVPNQMVGSLDVVAIQRQVRTETERVRRNEALVELVPGPDGEVDHEEVFARDPATDSFSQRAESTVLQEIQYERGWDEDRLRRELALRREVLRYMQRERIDDHDTVSRVIHTFTRRPSAVIEQIRAGTLDPREIYPWDVE